MYFLSDYNYSLPVEKIAQHPFTERSESKLLRIQRDRDSISHHRFKDILSLLKKDDLLVVNNTKVIPARLKGQKETGGKVEVLIIDYTNGMANLKDKGYFQCDCLIKASKSPKPGTILLLGDIKAVVKKRNDAFFEVRFLNLEKVLEFLSKNGELPLPPYIKRPDTERSDTKKQNQTRSDQVKSDQDSYQTVYAKKEGAVAAPTAGLHFTNDLIRDLEQKGIRFANITLHVGYGTFVPVRVNDIREHKIHSEYFSLSEIEAEKINKAKKEGRRIIAVGTTSVRTLEYLANEQGELKPCSGMCDLFIYPGYKFKCIDAMITNFHLPESTLLMLVSAFYEREKMLKVYETAVKENYRFFSYGDAMLIE